MELPVTAHRAIVTEPLSGVAVATTPPLGEATPSGRENTRSPRAARATGPRVYTPSGECFGRGRGQEWTGRGFEHYCCTVSYWSVTE